MDKKYIPIILVIVGIFLFFLTPETRTLSQQESRQYVYNINVNLDEHKFWRYIDSEQYNITLYNNDSIKIRLNISTVDPLDVVETRFYHPCNSEKDIEIGKIYPYINNSPALPTIGLVQNSIPIYFSLPKCPSYGTVESLIWDTDDTRMAGLIEYKYLYEGSVPMKFKTIELYIVKK